jgi:catechol-2,3-dioxygenase
MPIVGMNHAVLFVRDALRSAEFYREVLGFRTVAEMGGGRMVFLQAEGSTNDHDLGLFSVGDGAGPSTAGRQTVGLYHVSWEVETLDDLERLFDRLAERGSLVGATDHGATKAVYARDPDGLEFELTWLVPADLIDPARDGRDVMRPLDIAAEKERYGGSTRSGVGISTPRPAPVEA